MKKIIASLVLIGLATAAESGPRVWNKTGTATITTATLRVGSTATPFAPASLCVKNTGATNNLFFSLQPPAEGTDDSLNFLVGPGLEYCIEFATSNYLMDVAVITSTSTTTYLLNAIAKQ